MKNVLFLLALVAVCGCSLSLGAEKLQMDARTARKVEATVPSVDVTSARHDAFVIRKAFV